MASKIIEKEKTAQIKELEPKVTKTLSDAPAYKDELAANNLKEALETVQSSITTLTNKHLKDQTQANGLLNEIEKVGNGEKKPRFDKNSQPNAQKCKFSPFSYHRFTRAHKERAKSGSVIMVLRCRYCFEMQQVIIDFVMKDGRYIAQKTTSPVLEGPQVL